MKLKPEQLQQKLSQGRAPVYLITGDEPLIVEESCDAIRSSLRQQGFNEREVLHVEGGFKWEYLLECANALSLFAEQRLIEIRLGSQKINKAASDILQEYIRHAPAENCLLIIADKLDGNAKKSAWFKAIDQAGAIVEIWPVELAQLPNWIRQRAAERQLTLDQQAVSLLSDRVEGNLLAAKQELDKLQLLHPGGSLGADEVLSAVSDSSRYDVFGLSDAALSGQTARCLKILQVLRQEGVEPAIILWALSRDIRLLSSVRQGLEQGQNYDGLCQKLRIWGNRKALVKRSAQRLTNQQLEALIGQCVEVDHIVKGMAHGDSWLVFSDMLLNLTGHCVLAPAL